jgi:hypothetical protein
MTPMSTAPRPQLDAPVAAFDLIPAGGGDAVGLAELTASGPAVLALIDGGREDDARGAMLRELGRQMTSGSGRLVLVSPGDSALGRGLASVRAAEWLTDADGHAGRALGVLEGRKLRKARRRDGMFVIDREQVLRFAFTAQEPGQWIPAGFVSSRLERLAAVEPAVEPAPAVMEPQLDSASPEPELDALVREIGRLLGLSPNELTQLATASRFRDLGMSVVPDEIITKSGPLTDDEWAIIRRHPQRSAEMLGTSPLFANVRAIVRASHEHVDGSGYPLGLSGDDIPVGARILLVAESYLAMIFGRTYHRSPHDQPLDELRRDVGLRYDGRVVDALAKAVEGLPGLRADAA